MMKSISEIRSDVSRVIELCYYIMSVLTFDVPIELVDAETINDNFAKISEIVNEYKK